MATPNNTYRVELVNGEDETVEAYTYETRGDFIDFYQDNDSATGSADVVLRVRADNVYKIKMEKGDG